MPIPETHVKAGLFVLNVTELEPKQKHPVIFQHFDELEPGAAFQIRNDHDPKPLYYQLIAERGNIFTWKYQEQGPLQWIVEIRKNTPGETVGELAAQDVRKAEVFKKYGIDFCCGGRKTLAQACTEAGVNQQDVEAALQQSMEQGNNSMAADFTRWDADFLVDYIYNQHHTYYYQEGPVIADLAEKVAARHGSHFPLLYQLTHYWRQLAQELQTHFIKEERVVFPFIKALVKAKKTGDQSELDAYPSVAEPIQMMEADHEAAGEMLAAIRTCTHGFTLPEGACNSFTLLYRKLEALEADLHQHIHLENNILFPKAMRLERELRVGA